MYNIVDLCEETKQGHQKWAPVAASDKKILAANPQVAMDTSDAEDVDATPPSNNQDRLDGSETPIVMVLF